MADDWVEVAALRVIELADEVAALLYQYPGPLQRAVVFDALAELAGALRDADVRVARRTYTWRSIGEAFGVTQQAASKRWGR